MLTARMRLCHPHIPALSRHFLTTLPLSRGHVIAERLNVLVVAHSLDKEPRIDGDHRGQSESEDEDKSRICASEIAPGAASPVAFVDTVRAAPRFRTRLLFRSENLHWFVAPSVWVGLHYRI